MTLSCEMAFAVSNGIRNVYCNQPIVIETTRCESVDFIQTIDDQNKMFCTFMCEGCKREKSYLAERTRRGSVRDRAKERKG